MPIHTAAGLAHDFTCLALMEMIFNHRGGFFSFTLIPQIFVSEVFLLSAFLLLKSLISEEGGEAAVRLYRLGALSEK